MYNYIMKTPKVSIIVPAFNVEKYIEECVLSLTQQTYSNIEVIIVNDGSTDKTLDLCQKLAKQHRNLRIISQKNAGVSAARNTGLSKASGDFIAFVDGDDFVDKKYIELLVKNYKKHSIPVCEYDYIYLNSVVKNKIDLPDSIEVDKVLPNLIDADKNIGGFVWGRLFDKKTIKKYNLSFDSNIKLFEDALFLTKYLALMEKVTIVHQPLYYYRQRKKSIVHHLNKTSQIISVEKALAEIIKINLGYGISENQLGYLRLEQKITASRLSKKDAKKILGKDLANEIFKIQVWHLNLPRAVKIRYYKKRVLPTRLIPIIRQIKNRSKNAYFD